MVVETRDGFIGSLVKTKNPVRVLGGERTWSPVSDQSKPITGWFETEPDSNFTTRVVVNLTGEDTIVVQRTVIRGLHLFPLIPQTYRAESINDPENKWAGKIRHTSSQGNPVTPEQIEIK